MADSTSTSDQHDCSGDPACNVKNQQYHFHHLQLLWPRCAAPTFLHFLLVSCQHALIQVLFWCFVSLTRIFIETLVNLNTHSEILPPFIHLVRLALPCQAIPTRHCSPQHVRTSEFPASFLVYFTLEFRRKLPTCCSLQLQVFLKTLSSQSTCSTWPGSIATT